MPSPHNNIKPPHADPSRERRKLGRCWGSMQCCQISAVLPYLEITHTESQCHIGLCLIKPNTLWKLLGLDVPSVMSAQVDGRKLTLGTSCRCETVKVICMHFKALYNCYWLRALILNYCYYSRSLAITALKKSV